MRSFLLALFILDSIALIGLVLWHMSEHAALGGGFGGGMATTVFGRDTSKDPRKIAIGVLGTLFLILGLVLLIV